MTTEQHQRYHVTMRRVFVYEMTVEAPTQYDAAQMLHRLVDDDRARERRLVPGVDTTGPDDVTYVKRDLGITDVSIYRLYDVKRRHRDLTTTEKYTEGGEKK